MDPLILAISVSILAFVVVSMLAVFGNKKADTKALKNRLEAFKNDPNGAARAAAEEEADVSALKQRSYSGLPILSGFFKNMKGSEAVALQLERAGIPLRVGEYYMIRWSIALLMFAAPFVFGVTPFNLAVGLLRGEVGYKLPGQWVSNKRRKRTTRINAKLED